MKQLIVFDLDGTLAESKAAIDTEMARLLSDLTNTMRVAVISGGAWPQFRDQLVSHLPPDALLPGLALLPTCGTKFYVYDGAWKLLYAEDFTAKQKKKIVAALRAAVDESEDRPPQLWGEQIEDRGSQITFSALGQAAPLEQKKQWDPNFARRKRIRQRLMQIIPEFEIRLGGATSIDITRQGIDKGYGIRKLEEILSIPRERMLFIGDALFPGGNDYPAKEAGVQSIAVRDVQETKRVIEAVLACR